MGFLQRLKMKNTTEKTTLEKINEAWDNMPTGAKTRLLDVFGYKRQNVHDILKNGRKDESVLDSLLCAIKQASKDVTTEYQEQNEIVQSV